MDEATLARIAQSQGAHAVLLYGSEGNRQAEFAEQLARAWLCPSRTSTGACGECASCQSFERQNHPDFVRVEPSGRGNFIRLCQIESDPAAKPPSPHVPVREFARTPPLRAERKVLVLRQIHRLHHDAANALLKLLEEPPPYLRFALETDQIGVVLTTIRSRCLKIACEELLASFDSLGEASELAPHMPHLVESLLRNAERRAQFLRIVHEVDQASRERALVLSDRLRDLVEAIHVGEDSNRTSYLIVIEGLAIALRQRHPERSDRLRWLIEAHRRIGGNAHPGLVVDTMFARMP